MTLTLLGLFLGFGNAQSRTAYTEFGVGMGTLNYSGDIATSLTVEPIIREMRPQFYIFAQRNLNHIFSFGAEVNYGWLVGNDLNHTNRDRGLDVVTTMTQINANFELNFKKFGKYHYDQKKTFYIKGGGGFIAYNPNLNTQVGVFPENVSLMDDSYSSVNYFFGGGLKLRTSFHSFLRMEIMFHFIGADNLDGFELTDRISSNDIYGGIRIAYSYAIFKK